MPGATAAPLLAAADSSSSKLALAPLDGVRALCCAIIMCGHLFMYGVPQGSSGPYPIVGLEFLSAVSLFMVLSGFTLVVVYSGRKGAGPHDGQGQRADTFSAAASVRPFLTRRLARLAPMYYLSLLVALPWLLLYTSGANIAVSVPVALLMLQSLVPASLGGYWNGPLWQISALMLCYMAFPLLLGRLRALDVPRLHRLLKILALVALLFPLVVIGGVFGAGGGFAGASYIHTFGPYRIVQFVMGMAGGLLARSGAASSGGDPEAAPTAGAAVAPASTRRLNVLTAALVGCGAAVLVIVGCLPDGELRFYAWMGLNYFAEYSLPLLHVHWLLALTTAPTGAVSRFLQLPPLRWLGDASYAIYCLHWPVIMWCGWAVAGKGVTAEAMPLISRGGGMIEGWFPFPAWAVPLLVVVCAAAGSLAEKLLGSTARKARKAVLIGGAPAAPPSAAADNDSGSNAASVLAPGAATAEAQPAASERA